MPAARKELDQFDRVLVLGEIPHRAVTARIEHRVEVFLLDAVETNGLVELRFRLFVAFEAERELGAVFGLVALGIERWPSAFRGSQRDINAGILEDVVGSGELFEPETCLASGVTELVVGSDNHQHLHDCLLCLRSLKETPLPLIVEKFRHDPVRARALRRCP